MNFFKTSFFKGQILLGFLFIFLQHFATSATAQEKEKPARILFLVDASSSMLETWQGKESRFEAGARILSNLIDSIYAVNNEVSFAVRVFGSQYPAQDKNCFDSKLEVSFAYQNKNQIKARLKYLRPLGYSPIAWSLKEAAEKDFVNSDQYAYSIILVTDGGESCGGDICATVENLISKKISFTPYILSLIDYEPLKLEYECLGKYLQITNEKEIGPAIHSIVKDNRKILSVKTIGLPNKKTIKAPVASRPPTPKAPVLQFVPEPVQSVPEPAPSAPAEVLNPAPLATPLVARAKKPVVRISSISKPRKLNLLYTLEEVKPARRKNLPPVHIIIEEDKPKTSVVTIHEEEKKPVPPSEIKKPVAPAEPAETKVSTTTEDALETKMQIYFTNGKGKFYQTETNFNFTNAKTKETKSLFRTISGGEPTPLKVEEGMYDITFPGSKAAAYNVPILPNKTNKVYITVGQGSIGFIYPTARNKPVKEYSALVSKRFVPGSPVVKQACEEVLPYDPDNYHVEINTLPPLVYNVYVNFGELKLLSIPEPGTLQITNTERLGKVQFWHVLGDRYEPFLNMDVTGIQDQQKVKLLPGKYQVRYYKLPTTPNQKAELVQFSILKNQKTDIYLAP